MPTNALPPYARCGVRAVLALLALSAVAAPAAAHPDVFMETRVAFLFDAKGLAGIQVDLLFEKFFVDSVLRQADVDRDGKISPKEWDGFESLFHMDEALLCGFSHLWVDEKPVAVTALAGRTLLQGEGELGVRYTIPCALQASPGPARRVALAVFDENCYIRMVPAAARSVTLRGAEAFDARVGPLVKSNRIELDPSGPMNPAVTMSDPMEIRLEFSPGSGPATRAAAGARDTVVSYGRQEPRTLMERVWDKQQEARDWLADLNREHDRTHAIGPLLLMLLAAFLFGVLHALGPGHGKGVAAAYLLGEGRTLRGALVLGNLIPLFHTASGVAVSAGIHFFVARLSGPRAAVNARNAGEVASYALIFLVGVVFLVAALRSWRAVDAAGERLPHWTARFSSPVVLALAVGVFPCPTTILIMEMFIRDAALLGLLLVFFQALGMALTISVICVLVALGKLSAVKASSRRRRLAAALVRSMALVGAILIVFLGASFLHAALGRYYPGVLRLLHLA